VPEFRAPHWFQIGALQQLLLTLAICAGLTLTTRWVAGRETAARKWRPWLVRLGVLVNLRYLYWRVTATLPDFHLGIAEGFAYLLVVLEVIQLSMPSNLHLRDSVQRSEQSSEQLDWYGLDAAAPLIQILIPVCKEPWKVIERTLVGALGQHYPHFEVWVLDDGHDPALEQQVRALGANYLTRSNNQDFKSGNINRALGEFEARGALGEYIAILDADFVPRPQFLRRTLALMKDPTIAIVQTPQSFYSPDPVQRLFGGIRLWPDDQRWWYDFSQPALDARGGALCAGTSCLLRVRALSAIGGALPTASVSEDTLLSVLLRAQGWRTVYLAECLTVGMAAEGLPQFFSQRARWMLGQLQIQRLFRPRRSPLAILLWAWGYLAAARASLLTAMWAVAPLFYWFDRVWVVRVPVTEAAAYFVPLWMMPLLWGLMSKGRMNRFVRDVYEWLLIPLRLEIALRTLLPRGVSAEFRATEKGLIREQVVIHWQPLLFSLPWLGALGAGMLYAFGFDAAGRAPSMMAANAALSLYVMAVAAAAAAPAIERVQRRKSDRFDTRELLSVQTGSSSVEARAANISVEGVLVQTLAPREGKLPPHASLEIAGVGRVAVQLVRITPAGDAAYAFHDEALRPALIRKLYCSGHYPALPEGYSQFAPVLGFLNWARNRLLPRSPK